MFCGIRYVHKFNAVKILKGVCNTVVFFLKNMAIMAWRKLHKEDLRDLYSLPNIVRVVKSRRMRWSGHVARMGEGRGVHRVLVEIQSALSSITKRVCSCTQQNRGKFQQQVKV